MMEEVFTHVMVSMSGVARSAPGTTFSHRLMETASNLADCGD